MAKIATREAYGKALAELVSENENIVVLDADLSGSTKSGMAKKVAPDRHCNKMCIRDSCTGRYKITITHLHE